MFKLPYFHPDDIRDVINLIKDENADTLADIRYREKLEKFLEYFEHEWLSSPNKIRLWNCYIITDDTYLTNSNIEGANRKINEKLSRHRHSRYFWIFVRALGNLAGITYTDVEQIPGGQIFHIIPRREELKKQWHMRIKDIYQRTRVNPDTRVLAFRQYLNTLVNAE
jgi:hypothetical protein